MNDRLLPFLRGEDPPDPRPFVLDRQGPEPDQPWARLDRYGSREAAIDEARCPPGGAAPRTLYRVRRLDAVGFAVGPDWYGVVDRRGVVRFVPPHRFRTVALWEDRRTSAAQLFALCTGVDPHAVLAAAVACARQALSRVPGVDAAGERALAAAEAWAGGAGTPEAVHAAGDAAEEASKGAPDGTGGYSALLAAAHAAWFAGSEGSFNTIDLCAVTCAQRAALALELVAPAEFPEEGDAARALAPCVRGRISLGQVLAAYTVAG